MRSTGPRCCCGGAAAVSPSECPRMGELRRRADVEKLRQHSPIRSSIETSLRPRRAALFRDARDGLRPRRRFRPRSGSSSATTPTSPTISATSRAGCSRWRRDTSRARLRQLRRGPAIPSVRRCVPVFEALPDAWPRWSKTWSSTAPWRRFGKHWTSPTSTSSRPRPSRWPRTRPSWREWRKSWSTCSKGLRVVADALEPFMPVTSRKMMAMLAVDEHVARAPFGEGIRKGHRVREPIALFPRIEKAKPQ